MRIDRKCGSRNSLQMKQSCEKSEAIPWKISRQTVFICVFMRRWENVKGLLCNKPIQRRSISVPLESNEANNITVEWKRI